MPAAANQLLATVTAQPLAVESACAAVVVQADPDNAVDVFVGVAMAQPIHLAPGDAVTLPVPNVNQVYARSESGTALVNWLASASAAAGWPELRTSVRTGPGPAALAGPRYDARTFGVRGDGRRAHDAVTFAGTDFLGSADLALTAADVGKRVAIAGAGTAGVLYSGELVAVDETGLGSISPVAPVTVAAALVCVGTDNADAIAAARTGMGAPGGTLELPDGLILSSTSWEPNDRTILAGGGRGVTMLAATAEFAGPVVNLHYWTGDGSTFNLGLWHGIQDLTVEDVLSWDDPAAIATGGRSHPCDGIKLAQLEWVAFHDVRVADLLGYGVRLDDCVLESVIDNLYVWNCGDADRAQEALAIRSETGDQTNMIAFRDLSIGYPQYVGLGIAGSMVAGSRHLYFENVHIEGGGAANGVVDIGTAAPYDLVTIDHGTFLTFRGGVITNPGDGKFCINAPGYHEEAPYETLFAGYLRLLSLHLGGFNAVSGTSIGGVSIGRFTHLLLGAGTYFDQTYGAGDVVTTEAATTVWVDETVVYSHPTLGGVSGPATVHGRQRPGWLTHVGEAQLAADLYPWSGHLVGGPITGGGEATAVAGAQAGTDPPAPFMSGSDLGGRIVCGTGGGPTAGILAVVTFARAYLTRPIVQVQWAALSAISAKPPLAVPVADAGVFTGFELWVQDAPAGSQPNTTYDVTYVVLGNGTA